jgi:hypothetical protein
VFSGWCVDMRRVGARPWGNKLAPFCLSDSLLKHWSMMCYVAENWEDCFCKAVMEKKKSIVMEQADAAEGQG